MATNPAAQFWFNNQGFASQVTDWWLNNNGVTQQVQQGWVNNAGVAQMFYIVPLVGGPLVTLYYSGGGGNYPNGGFNVPQGGGNFTSPVIPIGTKSVQIQLAGGGGGSTSGSGGAGGAYCNSIYFVPWQAWNQSFSITIGAGGSSGGGTGGTSTITAPGAFTGFTTMTAHGSGLTGGTASGGNDLNLTGNNPSGTTQGFAKTSADTGMGWAAAGGPFGHSAGAPGGTPAAGVSGWCAFQYS